MNAESGAERVVIVGGGPAGAAAAALLGRAGASVVLLERGGKERGKVCGEGLLPPGLPVLAELGVLDALERGGARRLRGIRYVAPSGCKAQGDFPDAVGPGLAANELTERFERAGVRHVVFGHLHSLDPARADEIGGEARGVHYHCASCDFVDFAPIQIDAL